MTPSYDPADLSSTGDGITFVRRHPQMFEHLVPDGASASALLVEGSLLASPRRPGRAVLFRFE